MPSMNLPWSGCAAVELMIELLSVHVHSEFSVNPSIGRQKAFGDIMFIKCIMANVEASSVHIAATKVTNVELIRMNVNKCCRSLCRGIRLKPITIVPSIPDSINCRVKKKSKIVRNRIQFAIHISGKLTINPLQYEFSLALVLGAHQHSHSPRLATTNPTKMWKAYTTRTSVGCRMANGFLRRGAATKPTKSFIPFNSIA